jgi:tRNA1(Val) A37 N6-methylase TrmN6
LIQSFCWLFNRRVIELGAGSGLAGMCISKLFTPSEYVFTDHHEDVLQKLQDNLKLNKLEENPSLKVAKLDWTDVAERDLALWSPDVALASGTCSFFPLID